MKLKQIILVMALIFITGCSAEYTLVINDNETVDESIVALESNKFWSTSLDEVNEQLDWILLFAEDETEPAYFYNHEKILGKTHSGVKYSYNFSFNNFTSYSEFIKNCFENYDVSLRKERVQIQVSNFKCENQLGSNFDLKINIQANGTVIEGNYDHKVNNKYTWDIEPNEDVNIKLIIDNTNTDPNEGNTNTDPNDKPSNDPNNNPNQNSNVIIPTVIFITGFLIIIFGVLFVAYIKNRKNND